MVVVAFGGSRAYSVDTVQYRPPHVPASVKNNFKKGEMLNNEKSVLAARTWNYHSGSTPMVSPA